MQELFSVIVANYNNAPYLPALVESMQQQDYSNWELIIADDCSTDNSMQVLEQAAAQDKRITVVRHQTNGGAGKAFKTAMDHSRGALIGMLGADDALRPDALSLMAAAHKNAPQASMITSAALDCDSHLAVLGPCDISGKQPKGISFIHDIKVGNFVTYKREAYLKTPGFNPDFKRAVDHDLFLKLEEVGAIEFVNETVYYYRRHDGGISQGQNGMKAAEFSLRSRMEAYERRVSSGYPQNLSAEEYRSISLTYHQRRGQQLRNAKNYKGALAEQIICLKKSSGKYIIQPRFWKELVKNTASILMPS